MTGNRLHGENIGKFKIKDSNMYEIKQGNKPDFLDKEQVNIAFSKNLKDTIKKMKYLDYIEIPNEVNQITFLSKVRTLLKKFINEDIDFKDWRFHCKWIEDDTKQIGIGYKKIFVQRIDKPID